MVYFVFFRGYSAVSHAMSVYGKFRSSQCTHSFNRAGPGTDPTHMRARIVSTYMMIIFGLQPVASFFVGKSADLVGIRSMMRINGLFMVVLSALLLVIPRLYKLKAAVNIPPIRNQIIG